MVIEPQILKAIQIIKKKGRISQFNALILFELKLVFEHILSINIVVKLIFVLSFVYQRVGQLANHRLYSAQLVVF